MNRTIITTLFALYGENRILHNISVRSRSSFFLGREEGRKSRRRRNYRLQSERTKPISSTDLGATAAYDLCIRLLLPLTGYSSCRRVSRRGARHTIAQGDRDGGVGVGVGGGCRFSLGARRRRRGRNSRREYRDRPEGRPPAVYTSSVLSAATAYVHVNDPCFARARSPFQTSTSVVVSATVASTTAGKEENPK
ncbi:hypothetical protein QTP88_024379 [Uroleucon formosanum]